MEFLGLSEEDITSQIGSQILSATEGTNLQPDWGKIMDVCDIMNNEGPDTTNQAIRVLMKRLDASEHAVINLTLVLIEALMKNCREKFSGGITADFMTSLTDISKGNRGLRNSEEALRIIQDWGREFESEKADKPLFYDTYAALKARGLVFPAEDPALAAAT